ncbi:MAG TPA: serine--tRNA ligase [Candidatus Nanopelagicales bacterium]|nr:serine--tRNA ligase [Candidatus Nanopelagicales bacterium]
MIDLKVVREDPDRVRASQRARGEDEAIVDRLVAADEARRAAEVSFGALRNEQKELGKRIGPLQGRLKKADDAERAGAQTELDTLMAEASALAERVKAAEAERDTHDAETQALLAGLSNLLDPGAPVGGEDDFAVVEEVGVRRDFAAEGITVRDHVELGELLGAIDIERGAKVSGSRFYYLTGVGALLELALVNHAIALAGGNGFTPVIPPALVKPAAMEGTGFLGQAAENVYRLEQDDMYLVGTAEVPLAAYHSDEILDASTLPRRYVGYSPCYRRESGSGGRDTRGIFRVHWFDKVEMFSYAHPDDAVAEHQRLLGWERQFFDSLEIPYRVIDVASGDLGSSAARKFDIEAWVPSQERYREVTSTSNCTEFQARRLRIRMRDEDGVRPLATLNGTLVAITRAIVVLLENHQQADGSVRVPVALRPYLGGRETLDPIAR